MSQRETPYDWCKRKRATKGRQVKMTDASGGETVFTIVRKSKVERKVTFALPGVWTAREWREMDRECEYELVERKGE